MDFADQIAVMARQFLAGVSLKSFNFMINDLEWQDLDQSWQVKLLQATLQNPHVQKYPPQVNYQRFFLKKLIQQLEINKVEVAEEIYECYVDLMQQQDTDNFAYRIYMVSPELEIILKESTLLISQGTTGLVTWQAAKALTEWCLLNRTILQGRNVLELGCGLGLTGITACKTCKVASYSFSDCHPQVLELLRHNLEINFKPISEEVLREMGTDKFIWQSTSISVIPFHWDDEGTAVSIFRETKPDVILAADVIYEASIIGLLLRVLQFFLKNDNSDGGRAIAYIACTVRNEDTLHTFYKEADCLAINYEEIPCPTVETFFYDAICPMKMFKLFTIRFHYNDVCTIKVEVPTNFNDVTCACNGANIKVMEIKNPKCVTSLQDVHVHVNGNLNLSIIEKQT